MSISNLEPPISNFSQRHVPQPLIPSQPAEWLPARVVLMFEPALETLFSILQTDASNFLFPFSLKAGADEHRHYRRTLEAAGVTVIDIREALQRASHAQRVAWARSAVTLNPDAAITDEDRRHLDAHLQTTLDALDDDSLIQLILLRPLMNVRYNDAGVDPTTRFITRYEINPPSPYYTRDPYITTREGVVITRLLLDKRRPENDIASHVLEALGITPLHRIEAPGTLEGGDFIPCGDFVLQGQGLLTNAEGVRQCLEHRVYGRVEVAVVRDPRMNMDEMHLDTYFAMLDKDLAACVDTRLSGDEAPAVDVYLPEGDETNYTHKLSRTLPFATYLQEKGIRVIPFSKHEQDNFAANGLLIAPRKLIGVTRAGAAFEQRLRDAGVDTHFIPFDALTGGYGGPHCSSQVLLRR